MKVKGTPPLLKPKIFGQLTSVASGFTLRTRGPDRPVWDMTSDEQRLVAIAKLGFGTDRLARQRQVHGKNVVAVEEDYEPGESDALVTDMPEWLLGISVADCVPILFADPGKGVVGAAHSGWRGTRANIAAQTVHELNRRYSSNPGDLFVWIGPSAMQCCYEVGSDVAENFDSRFSHPIGDGKWLFDNAGVVLSQLLDTGVRPDRVELVERCTICDVRFHSWRRDRNHSGRMLALIGLRST